MPPQRGSRTRAGKQVESLRHEQDSRTNIPTAEYQSLVSDDQESPLRKAYQRRNRDLDPQLVWRGKDDQDLEDLVVNVPPLYIQEKVQPKALIDDLVRRSRNGREPADHQIDLFADFNGLPDGADRTEFYQHDGYWQNRMIVGDSLQVMASLSEREGLQGKVQCIYIDPPYGIRFNSNFQWSTTSRDVKDGNKSHITREPEQVKAFRDTWRDGIHSYLTYLRDRLTLARELLADSGSIFVQIGDGNSHRVRELLDEIFGSENFVSQIIFAKTTGFSGNFISNVSDYMLWYAKNSSVLKYRGLHRAKVPGRLGATAYRPLNEIGSSSNDFENFGIPNAANERPLATSADLTSQGASLSTPQEFSFHGKTFAPPAGLHWKASVPGMNRLGKSGRVFLVGNTLRYLRFMEDYPIYGNYMP